MMTFRPLGPSVTLTARASLPTPRFMASRASWSNAICLALIGMILELFGDSKAACGFALGVKPQAARQLVDDREHVFFAHDQQVVAGGVLLLDFVAGPR